MNAANPTGTGVLLQETYNAAERIGRQASAARVLEAFQPVMYALVGYPTRIDDISELQKFADAMQERRTDWIINDLLGGLTHKEFTHAKEINDAVCALSREHFGRRMVARSSLLRAINTLRHILHLCGDERPAILEVGPGQGYLGALLMREGFPYVATEVTQAFYLYQYLL